MEDTDGAVFGSLLSVWCGLLDVGFHFLIAALVVQIEALVGWCLLRKNIAFRVRFEV